MTSLRLRHLTVVAALICAGCSPKPTSTAPDKYTQTWPKGYSETTCTEWTNKMTDQQKFAAAADMLTGARNKGDGGSGLPPDSLIQRFAADVGEGCSVAATADGLSVADAAVSVYLIGRDTYKP